MVADVAPHPFLGSVLAHKGGTALNLCFEAPRHLSVDLDFNYVVGMVGPGSIYFCVLPRDNSSLAPFSRAWPLFFTLALKGEWTRC
jgi:hypothetical protein